MDKQRLEERRAFNEALRARMRLVAAQRGVYGRSRAYRACMKQPQALVDCGR
jgi:hypothetical protein